MSQFLGTHQNKVDAKGRVSIPAGFRAALRALEVDGTPTLILRPSHKHPCIEGWPAAEFSRLETGLDRLQQFSDDHDDLATTIYADAFPVETDKEGRIVVPPTLIKRAGLGETVVFMGKGRTFEIWDCAAGEQRRIAAAQQSLARKLTLAQAPPVHVAAPA